MIPSLSLCAHPPASSTLPAFSRLVFGAWRLHDQPDASPATVLRLIEQCLDVGITTFDHADIYGNYRCEALFGQALALAPGLKHRLQLVSKCDIMLVSHAHPQRRTKHYDTRPEHIRASVEQSLRHLGTDCLDLLLIHRPDPLMDAGATGACLDALIDAGLLRAAGVSNFMPWDLELLQAHMRHRLVTNQIEISLLDTSALDNGLLAQAQRLGMPPMAWSPLGGGRLVRGQGTAAQRLRPRLEHLAAEQGVDLAAIAHAWLLQHPARILPVVGTHRPERIARLADAFKVSLSRETWFELLELARGHEVA
jgi:predicted oxidoreductase